MLAACGERMASAHEGGQPGAAMQVGIPLVLVAPVDAGRTCSTCGNLDKQVHTSQESEPAPTHNAARRSTSKRALRPISPTAALIAGPLSMGHAQARASSSERIHRTRSELIRVGAVCRRSDGLPGDRRAHDGLHRAPPIVIGTVDCFRECVQVDRAGSGSTGRCACSATRSSDSTGATWARPQSTRESRCRFRHFSAAGTNDVERLERKDTRDGATTAGQRRGRA